MISYKHVQLNQIKPNGGYNMSNPTVLDIKTELRSSDRSFIRLSFLKIGANIAQTFGFVRKMAANGSPSLPNSKPRIGASVDHSRYGNGKVMAHYPDGTILVRFDNSAKNRRIWLSFLNLANNQRR